MGASTCFALESLLSNLVKMRDEKSTKKKMRLMVQAWLNATYVWRVFGTVSRDVSAVWRQSPVTKPVAQSLSIDRAEVGHAAHLGGFMFGVASFVAWWMHRASQIQC